MRKQLISFALVIKFCKISSSRRGGLTPKPPLAYALDSCHSSVAVFFLSVSLRAEFIEFNGWRNRCYDGFSTRRERFAVSTSMAIRMMQQARKT